MSNKYPDKTPVMNRRDMPRGGNYDYIGRGSGWGNPFKIGDPIPDAAHGEKMGRIYVVVHYLHYFVKATALHQELHTLHGNSDGVVCYCSPKACHGEVLTAFVDAYRKYKAAPHTYNGRVLADGRTIPKGGYDISVPEIKDLPPMMLIPHFYGVIDGDNAHAWEFRIGDHLTGYFECTTPTVYDAIRGGLESYFEAKVVQGKLLDPARDEEFVSVEWFLKALTAHGYSICEYNQGRYVPVAKDVTEWVVLPYGLDEVDKPDSDGDESG